MSADTLKRVLKACRMRRQCIQQVPSNHPPQTDDQRKRIALDILKEIGTAGRIEPDYMDEPGSTLVPLVPYAWKDQNVLLEFSIRQSKHLNVFVFIYCQHDLKSDVLGKRLNDHRGFCGSLY